MIYFIKQGDYVKIGYTSNIQKRIAQLQTSSPNRLKLIGLIDGTLDDESEYHRRFSHLRGNGEWFVHTQGLDNFINALNKDLMYKEGFLGLDEDFTKVYKSFDSIALNINSGMSYKLLFWILGSDLPINSISIGSEQLSLFNKYLEEDGGKIISKATYYRCIIELCSAGAIIKIGKSNYYLNPNAFWKGTKAGRDKVLQEGLEINLEN